MTIILFLVDTSASMSQRTYLGARPTLLDVAKDAIEKFLKLRQKDPASRGDRYMLLTFEESPYNVKAGWKAHHNAFMTELKNLTATGMTTLGPSLKQSFDLLNLNRMQTGIDTYGQGRCPFYLEPSVIIVITDGGKLSNSGGIQDTLTLPMHSFVPGSELTKEPFRWDQRLFALVLRLTGTVPPPDSLLTSSSSLPACDDSPIDSMCNVTGGRSYSVTSQRSLMSCLDSIVSKIQGGVVIHFEKVGPDPLPVSPVDESSSSSASSSENGSRSDKENSPGSITGTTSTLLQGALMSPTLHDGLMNGSSSFTNGTSGPFNDSITLTDCDKANWTSSRKLIYVQRSAQKGYSVGHWPIPESFWPDLSAPSLPARTAHPCIKFTCSDTVPMTIENLPFDKYELEPCPLTKVILSRKSPHVAWQCYVSNSHKNSDTLGFPFGYLKASSNMSCVNLFVLPYNYPALLPLLDDLIKNQIPHNMKPTREWRMAFESYLSNLPAYYAAPLKRAFQRMGAPPSLIPESMETCLSYQVLNYLKRLKNQAKAEFDKSVSLLTFSKSSTLPESIRVSNPSKTKKASEMALSSTASVVDRTSSLMDRTSSLMDRTSSLMDRTSSLMDHPRFAKMKPDINDYQGFVTRMKEKYSEVKSQSYRNPYDINRHELIDQIYRMRANFLLPPSQIKLQDEDQIHSLPVCQMGNYQEYLKRIPSPLRELESAPMRQHMFGNPFKIDKRGNQGVQVPMEDIDLVGGEGNASGSSSASSSGSPSGSLPIRSPKRSYGSSDASNPNRNKRKPGPLPKDYTLKPPLPSPSFPSPLPSQPVCDTNHDSSELVIMENNDQSFQTINQSEDAMMIHLAHDDDDDDDTSSSSISFDSSSSDPVEVHVNLSPISSDSGLDSDDGHDRKTLNNHEEHLDDEEEDGGVYSLVRGRDEKMVEFEPLEASRSRGNFDYAKANGTCGSSSRASPPITLNSFSYSVNGSLLRLPLNSDQLLVKKHLFKLVKMPGKNYQPLLDSIHSIKNHSFKEYIIHQVKLEALRFKRKHLVSSLNQTFSHCNNHHTTRTSENHFSSNNHHHQNNTNEMNKNDVTYNRKNPLLKSYVE